MRLLLFLSVCGTAQVLVDREQGSARSQADKVIQSCGGHVTRVTVDIRHLLLARAGKNEKLGVEP